MARRQLALVVALALAAALLPPLAAGAQVDCAAAPFTDRAAIPEAHRGNVDCAYEEGIARGSSDGRFGPTSPVRRDQVVSFLERTLRAGGLGDRLPAPRDRGFRDIRGNVHADAIDTMAAAGVVRGTSDTTFSPAAPVTRAQLASFVLRALAWAQGVDVGDLQSDRDRFGDVARSDVHRRNINGAADRELIRGVSSDRFAPASNARRDQTVTMLFRLLAALPDPDGAGTDDGGVDDGGTDDGGTDDGGTDDGGGDGGTDDGGTDDGGGGGGIGFPAEAAVHGVEVRADAVRLSWSPASDADAVAEYRVELIGTAPTPRAAASAASASDGTVVATTTGLSAEVDGLTRATTYAFRVRAVGGDGEVSSDGPTTTVTTLDTDPPLDLDLTLHTDRSFQNNVVNTASYAASSSTRAPDGTTYQLSLPKGALLSEEVISLTPILAADGLPGGGEFVAGVKLEPEGLLLREPATLRIVLPEGATPPPAGHEVPMAFEGDGRAVRLAAFDPPGSPFTSPPSWEHSAVYEVQVDHFSGVVLSEGGAPERADVLDRAHSRQDQIAGQIADGIAAERAAQLAGGDGDPEWPARLETLLRQARDEVVQPLLDAAESNDALAQEAVSTALSWLRQMALLGLSTEDDDATISAAVERILRGAYEQARARCLANADLREALTMLGIMRSLELMSANTYPMTDLEACLGQEFDVDVAATTWHRNTSEIEDGLQEVSGSLAGSVRAVRVGELSRHTPIRFVGSTVPTASDIEVSPRPRVCDVRDVALAEDAHLPVIVEPNLNPLRDVPGALLVRLEAASFRDPFLRASLQYRAGFESDGTCERVDSLRTAHFVGTDLGFAFRDLVFRVPIDGSISRSGSRMTPCPPNCYPFQTSLELSLTRRS